MVFSATWFMLAALLLTTPQIAMTFLLLVTQSFPPALMILFHLSSVLFPSISTFPVGAILGSRILALTPGKTTRAALIGLFTGLTTFTVWVALLEVIPGLNGFFPSANSGGDVPEVAVVVTYLIVLPGILTG